MAALLAGADAALARWRENYPHRRYDRGGRPTIAAPHSGMVGDFAVRAGDVLSAGDALFTLSADKIYADFDGTITGVFAQPGDSASSVQDRYGALCYMERDTLYTANCTTAGAAS